MATRKKKPGIPGIKRYFEPKSGNWYSYHRKTGRRIEAEYGTADFVAEVARINEEVAKAATGNAKAGTLGALITMYRATAMPLLATRTRTDYQKVFDYLKPMRDQPLAAFTSGAIVKIRDKAYAKHKRRFANYVVAVFSIIFEFAREREMVSTNPVIRTVKKIRRPKGMADANRAWSQAEREAVMSAAPIHLKVPIALAMYVGLREGDVLRMTWARYNGHDISTTTSKAGTFVWWRCPVALREILDEAPHFDEVPEIAATSRGTAWTESGFRASWRKFRMALEQKGLVQPGLTIHGLRHTVATTLREQGFDTRTIADALGQKTEIMAAHYSKNADLKNKMATVTDAMDRLHQNEQEQKLSRRIV
ncbi:hypothetical protein VW29_02470 [Devosia limi DSM 17137]|uniref:Phage integrase family protein n=1 Tax=Devosia limi DSM 17137 TaxID=1121477 RepID=A0A0F5LW73_9HYPH|nr:tyrosine-type recombinase/integrase [Devosia limi]KKB86444.1 hypothetical protein VW29_02470 [Devosia limi DSM 17137]SHE88817.1 Phage integrase family protein [Devosia limi DSM 17137]